MVCISVYNGKIIKAVEIKEKFFLDFEIFLFIRYLEWGGEGSYKRERYRLNGRFRGL